jgi:hypothetical protein
MTGEFVPYVLIGRIHATLIIVLARAIFAMPLVGSRVTLYLALIREPLA